MDYLIFSYLNNLAGRWPLIDGLAVFLADYLIYFLIILAVIFFFILPRAKRWFYVLTGFLGLLLSRGIITEVIRWLWPRPRPFLSHQVVQLISHETSASLPSGHTTFLFALAMVIFLFNRKWGFWFLLASLFVGLARIFVGVHYPLDILIGILIGISSSWVVYLFISKKYFSKIWKLIN